ncbi:MAG TPA: acyl carrier protein [Kofleriaceae bacterium]|nr:acyl carrier protein [Kofleriaceae bacterium]
MSGDQAVVDALYEFVARELLDGDAEELTPTTNLLALGVIDSLAMVSLRVFIERTFGVRLPDGLQPEAFATIGALAEIVERLKDDPAAQVKKQA